MNIESLEINLLKASKIEDGDLILVKIDEKTKSSLNPDKIKNLYAQITKMLNKEVSIYFFPSDMTMELVKKVVLDKSQNEENTQEENL